MSPTYNTIHRRPHLRPYTNKKLHANKVGLNMSILHVVTTPTLLYLQAVLGAKRPLEICLSIRPFVHRRAPLCRKSQVTSFLFPNNVLRPLPERKNAAQSVRRTKGLLELLRPLHSGSHSNHPCCNLPS